MIPISSCTRSVGEYDDALVSSTNQAVSMAKSEGAVFCCSNILYFIEHIFVG